MSDASHPATARPEAAYSGSPSGRPAVVVIGGGYAGVSTAKALDELADVILVEPKDDFVHNVASLRALADPSWLPRIYLPYGGLLARGRVIQDRAVKVDAGLVTLGSGEEIHADYIVLASGSGYPFPAKSDVDSTAAAHEKVRAAHDAVSQAARVLIVGAGPVGIELAGEIIAAWPGKQVTLLDAADDILGVAFRPELKAELRRQLTDIGVRLLLASPLRQEPPAPPGELRTFTVTTTAGAGVTADIWFRCYGVMPASDYLAGELAAARRDDGFIDVNPYLQVAGQDRVFALGDVASADRKMAAAGGRQHPGADRRGSRRAHELPAGRAVDHRADRPRGRLGPAGRPRRPGAGRVRRPGQGPRHDGGALRRATRRERERPGRYMSDESGLDAKLLGLVASHRQGVLATVAADGRPQLSNVLYVWDAERRTARISTTADRAKAANLRRDPRAALHVPGRHFWQFAVAEGPVTLADVAAEPGDPATRELLELHGAFYGKPGEDTFFQQMIAGRRLVVRLHVHRVYGVFLDNPPGA